MPNAHFDVSIISRGGGHRGGRTAAAASAYRSGTVVSVLAAASIMGSSVVASASYRSGETLYDQRAEKTFDYRAKEDVIHSEIMVPENAPVWAGDRQILWNQVEQKERRKDAQLARDIIAALPRELNYEQQIALVREFVRSQFVNEGMIADFSIHDKLASDGKNQPHCHIMLTLRHVDREGFGKKNRNWNKRTLVSNWRDAWEAVTNRHLEAAGRDERVSLRSYEEQGVDKVPGQHMGAQAWNMENKGQETAKGDRNRAIDHDNEVSDLIRKYEPRDEPDAADRGQLSAPGNGKDAALLGSVRVEANQQEGEDALHRSRGSEKLAGESYSDAQLEAMHWASVRQAVRGVMQHSMQRLAEQLERARRYGRVMWDTTQQLVRTWADPKGKPPVARASKERDMSADIRHEATRRNADQDRRDWER